MRQERGDIRYQSAEYISADIGMIINYFPQYLSIFDTVVMDIRRDKVMKTT
jgi:hypothetical protein